VVDYAERWPLSDLLALLLDRRLHAGRALRVLLLARPLGAWWEALTYRLSEALGVHADSTELAALDSARIGPREVYEVARRCFAEALGVADPGSPAPEPRGSFLTVHMAALAHVLAVRHGETPPTDPAQLSAYLLSRERSHWQSMYDNDRRIESTPLVMGRAVYVAALTRSLDYASAVPVLSAVAVVDGAGDAGRVLGDHAMCYPPHDRATVLEPLYPDRLAEDFVALQSQGHAIDRFRPDPWATGALTALAYHSPRVVSTMFPLVIEAARRWPHLATDHLLPLLRKRPELAIHAGSSALSALAATPAVPLDVLAAIDSALPDHPRILGQYAQQLLQGGYADVADEGDLEDVAFVQPSGRFRHDRGLAARDRDARHEQRVGRHAEGDDLALSGVRDGGAQPLERRSDGRMIRRIEGPAARGRDQRPGKRRHGARDFR